MAGDIGVSERLIFPGQAVMESAAAGEPVLHEYGPNIQIALSSVPELLTEAASGMAGAEGLESAAAPLPELPELNETEQLGLEALQLRLSPDYRAEKEKRRYSAVSWDAEKIEASALHAAEAPDASAQLESAGYDDDGGNDDIGAAAAPPLGTSDRLKGRIAVAVIMVSGPGQLALSAQDRLKVAAEVQNGLGWLGSQSPARDVTFVYEMRHLMVNVPEVQTGNNYEVFEAPWRNAAMGQLGVGPGLANIRAYVNALRTRLNTDWAYCAFFTRYKLFHFAYAGIGGPRLVMHFENDGWGVENIDRVFAHETGHIFGAPDEYANSNCNCGGAWGHYRAPNSNCQRCAQGGGVPCLMSRNEWAMCEATKLHLGF